MAEKYFAYSPYHYVRNNPINLYDPNGMYDASPTDSKNTSLATPDGIVGGAGSRKEKAEGTVITPRVLSNEDPEEATPSSSGNTQGFPCNIDKYKLNMSEGGDDPRAPVSYHTGPLAPSNAETLNKQIADFVEAIDCGAGGKLKNDFYIEIGYILQSQKFSSAQAFNNAKTVWLKTYLTGATDSDLRNTINDFMINQNYSFWGNKTLQYPDIGQANFQHNAARTQLLNSGIPLNNIGTMFNHSHGKSTDLYLSVNPNPIFKLFKRVPKV